MAAPDATVGRTQARFSLCPWPGPEAAGAGGALITEYPWAVNKDEILPFATTWMELEGTVLCKMNQAEDRCRMMSLLCGTSETKK